MKSLEPSNFNGLTFRDGDRLGEMVFASDIDKWISEEEYKAYKMEQINQLNNRIK